MFQKVLIANRGEIALRVARTCRELGIRTVAVYSTADAECAHVRFCDESVCIGPPASARSYRNAAAIIEAARMTGADAVHPGYGFLSEDPDFAEICAAAGLAFIGPPHEALQILGDKVLARTLMERAGMALLSGPAAPASAAEAKDIADGLGYPVIIKAAAGGGGRGMTVAWSSADFSRCYAETAATSLAIFGDVRVYVERYLRGAQHVEVQLLCDQFGGGLHLGTRDCTVQRRYQKLIEEAPAPGLSAGTLQEMSELALRGALAAGYVGVGTAEFLVDADERHYFLEINSRIQVEHPVTEMVTGIDMVEQQFRVASGSRIPFRQEELSLTGHAIECRVNAEDPDREFAPAPGVLDRFVPPGGPFTRVDSHGRPGYRIGPDYDSLLAKVIVWAPDRDQAISRMERALAEFDIAGDGISTTIPFLALVLADPNFRKAEHSNGLAEFLAAERHRGKGREDPEKGR